MYSWALNAFSLVNLSEVSLSVFDHFCGKKWPFYGVGDFLILWLKEGTLTFIGPIETLQIPSLTCFPWPCPSQLLQRIPSVLAGARTPYCSLCLLPLQVHSANSCSRFNLSAISPGPFLQSWSLASWSLACTYVWGFCDSGVGLCIYWFRFTSSTAISSLFHLAMVSLNGNPMLSPMHASAILSMSFTNVSMLVQVWRYWWSVFWKSCLVGFFHISFFSLLFMPLNSCVFSLRFCFAGWIPLNNAQFLNALIYLLSYYASDFLMQFGIQMHDQLLHRNI